MKTAVVLDRKNKSDGSAVTAGIYELANKLADTDKTKSADLFCATAKSYRKRIGSLTAEEIAALKRAILKSGSLFRELAIESTQAGDKTAAAAYWQRAADCFKQSISPLAKWQADARDQGATRAGNLYRELAVEAEKTSDRLAAAENWNKASECFKQALLPLTDWQLDARDQGPIRAGNLYRELAVEAEKGGDKSGAGEYWTKASECFRHAVSQLADWQLDARDDGPARAGNLYRELAVSASASGQKESGAEHWLKAAESYRQSPLPLTDWQEDVRNRGPVRAGSLYRELAVAAAESGEKEAAAEYWVKAAQSFRQSPLPLAYWQVDARDQGPARAGSLYRELAVEAQKAGDMAAAAGYYKKASASFELASCPLAEWQQATRDQGRTKAENLLRQLAKKEKAAGKIGQAADHLLEAV